MNHRVQIPRGKSRVPVFETKSARMYATFGMAPRRNGKGLHPNRKHLDDDNMLIHRKNMSLFWAKFENIAKEYIDSKSLFGIGKVKEMVGYSGFSMNHNIEQSESSIWTSVALAKNVLMNAHTDEDFFMGGITALSEDGYTDDDKILQFFCFPNLGIAIPLRHGDVLLFNPKESHCVSSRVSQHVDVIMASMYLKTAVVGGNNNDRTVNDLNGVTDNE